MNTPYMTLHGNLPEMFSELERKLAGKQQHFRVGTGEYADSLAMEELTGISAYLVEQFAGYENLTLELKTKSAMVDSLLDLEHNGNTVIAWSLNPQSVIDEVEPGTASLQERLDAAVRAADAGYRLAFHLDPVVYTEDWKREYSDLIETIGAQMRGRSIDWFSLGAFRYSPALKEIIQMRFPKDKLTVPEMIQGADGKYRYFKTIRRGMFDYLTKKINEILPGVFHYLCMETRSMWEKVYGEAPRTPGVLEARFEKNTKNSNPAS